MKLHTLTAALITGAVFTSAHALNNSGTVTPAGSGYRIQFASTGAPLVTTGTPTVSNGATTGEALIRDLFKAPGPAGKTIDVAATRTIPWGTLARTVGRGLGWLGAGLIVYDIYEQLRARKEGNGWVWDAGQPPEMDAVHCAQGNICTRFGAAAAYTLFATKQAEQYQGYKTREIVGQVQCNAQGDFCHGLQAKLGLEMSNGQMFYQYIELPGSAITRSIGEVGCPAVPGATNPVYQVKGGPKGPDGKCPTGKVQPMTEADAAKLFEDHAPKEKAAEIAREALQNDAKFEPAPATKVSGPAKVQGEPRTVTETDAQGNTKTTTKTDVYNITYEGDSYSWTTTTVTNNPDGSTKEEQEEPDRVTPPADPDLPELPKLYEPKFPNGMEGVWNDNVGAVRQSPIFQFLDALNPNLGNGGCPSWTFSPGRVLGINVSGDLSVPCTVWSVLRVIFTISALLACRRLIFGG